MKQAILVASFGTTHLDTLEKTVCAVERDIQTAFPEVPCFRAFTSRIVRKRLKENQGMTVDSVEEALEKLKAAGFTHVAVQPTLLLPGEEYDRLRAAAMDAAGGLCVRVGCPLLWQDCDLKALAQAVKEAYPVPEDTVLLGMGHGTSHTADGVYSRLRGVMREMDMELCTVEGSIDFAAAQKALLAQPRRKVHLVPLLLVAGDHSKNDMAGTEPDSLKSILTEAGFEVTYALRGLGELEAVRKTFCTRLAELLEAD